VSERDSPKKPGFFSRLTAGLRRSSTSIADSVTAVFTKKKLDAETLEQLEDALIAADLGTATAMRVTDRLARDRFEKEITDEEVRTALAETIAETLAPLEAPLEIGRGAKPEVVLFVGVNGSGKTTTLGKIAARMKHDGQSCLLVAGDTFRAAAVEQISVWGERAGLPVEIRDIGSDAAGLAFDAVQRAKREGLDAVLIDTAGRLQNRTELMDELRKIVRVLKKVDEAAPHKVILVLDGTVGSNALSQAEAFREAANVTGLIMTKLDGTAKGGALVQVAEKFALPIHAIGIGEGIDDLQTFNARAYSRAIAGLDEA
jgi:fused signal recognition particle receptor